MPLTIDEGTMPPASDYPFPSTGTEGLNDPTYNVLSWRCQYDSDWLADPLRKAVFYFHGSGAREPTTGSFVDALYNDGYVVFQPMHWGSWVEPFYNCPAAAIGSAAPYRFNYGSVTAPPFVVSFIKLAWHVKGSLEYFLANFPWTDITLIGHSAGADAVIGWSAGYANEHDYGVRGILSSGATAGAANNGTWQDMNRLISVISQPIALLRHKAILAWGNLDASGPPDYQRRIQQAVPVGKDTYFVSPGDGDHHWDTDPAYFQHFVNWTEQLAEGSPILDRFGNPAVPGPAI